MSEVVTLAEKVVTELEEYGAELSFFPEFELRDLDEMRVLGARTFSRKANCGKS